MSRAAKILLRVTFLAFGIACGGMVRYAPSAPVPADFKPKCPLFPTQLGTTWVYESKNGEFTRTITAAANREDGKLVTIVSNNERDDQCLSQKILVNSKGVYLSEGSPFLFIDQPVTYEKPFCLLRAPYKEGNEWEESISLEGGGGLKGKLKIVGLKTLTVPAGKFETTEVNWSYTETISLQWKDPGVVYWYADGIGIIQIDERSVWKLKSFRPGK